MRKFPEGFLGVYDLNNNFICVECIGDDEDVDDEDDFTAALDSDAWFEGEICSRHHELVEKKTS